MATVELRPVITSASFGSQQETPLGVKEIESNFNFSYEELITRLNGKSKPKKSKKSGTEGAKFSRIVALSANALKKENGRREPSTEEVFKVCMTNLILLKMNIKIYR